MTTNIDLEKPLFQCTLGDLKAILIDIQIGENQEITSDKVNKRYVYGIAGLAKLFGCSLPTAQRIKSSGEIDDAISQIGSIIIVDADYALDIIKLSKKYRKSLKLKNHESDRV
jgi:hypothetical protein